MLHSCKPGFDQIHISLCEVIREYGGEIVTGARVREVFIGDRKVKGVLVEINGNVEKIDCPVAVNSGIINGMFQYIPQRHFTCTFVKRVSGFRRAGIGQRISD
jgi:phytoene dehydrogenase-like protein